jgi:raffinose/stachyose/melibiose transport system permease protein
MAALMQVMKSLNLMNNQFGIILLYASINLPTALFIVHGFVGTIPRELDEAALIDGAHPMRLFTSIIMPLLPPVLVTVALLVFTGIWTTSSTRCTCWAPPLLADDAGHLQLLRHV